MSASIREWIKTFFQSRLTGFLWREDLLRELVTSNPSSSIVSFTSVQGSSKDSAG